MATSSTEYLVGRSKVVDTVNRNGVKGFKLPSGLCISYPNLRITDDSGVSPTPLEKEKKIEYEYSSKPDKTTRIYGAKAVENIVQGLARCIIGEQMIQIAKRYKVVLTVHDSVLVLVKKEEVEEGRLYIEACMREVPYWAKGLPLDCESGVGENYGDCK